MAGGYGPFLLALGVFLATHLVPAVRPLRAALISVLGRGPYLVLLSAVSLAALVGLIGAARAAPYDPLWPWHPWTAWGPLLVMPVALALGIEGLRSPNPFSLTLSRAPYDPARAGVVALTRHPVPWALGLWAAAHVMANESAALVVFFTVMTGLAAAGTLPLEARRRRALGAAEWRRLHADRRRGGAPIRPGSVLLALAVHAVLLAVHPVLFGADPLAPVLP